MRTPSLTAILHEDFKDPPSGLTGYVIADLVGKNYQTLMSELSRQHGHKLGADLVLPIMQKTGSARGVEFLSREMGGEFVALPRKVGGIRRATTQCVSAIKEFSDLMQVVTAALEDNEVSPREWEQIKKEGHEAVQAILVLMKAVEQEMEAGRD